MTTIFVRHDPPCGFLASDLPDGPTGYRRYGEMHEDEKRRAPGPGRVSVKTG